MLFRRSEQAELRLLRRDDAKDESKHPPKNGVSRAVQGLMSSKALLRSSTATQSAPPPT
jgi:hypothetical protein